MTYLGGEKHKIEDLHVCESDAFGKLFDGIATLENGSRVYW